MRRSQRLSIVSGEKRDKKSLVSHCCLLGVVETHLSVRIFVVKQNRSSCQSGGIALSDPQEKTGPVLDIPVGNSIASSIGEDVPFLKENTVAEH